MLHVGQHPSLLGTERAGGGGEETGNAPCAKNPPVWHALHMGGSFATAASRCVQWVCTVGVYSRCVQWVCTVGVYSGRIQ